MLNGVNYNSSNPTKSSKTLPEEQLENIAMPPNLVFIKTFVLYLVTDNIEHTVITFNKETHQFSVLLLICRIYTVVRRLPSA